MGLSSINMLFEPSGVDCSEKILTGRPYGGRAIYFKHSLAGKTKRDICMNWRICALTFNNPGLTPLLIVNVYMPCDTYSASTVNPAYSDTIYDIETLINEHDGGVLLCGNWNTDINRSTARSNCFENFIERNQLRICWDHMTATSQNTYANFALDHFSRVDHFVMSNNMFECLKSCSVNTSPLHPSDHRDIFVDFHLQSDYQGRNVARCTKDKVAWHRVNDEDVQQYKLCMDGLLHDFVTDPGALACNDPLCHDSSHIENIERLCEQLISTYLNAGKHSFPKCAPPRAGYSCGTSALSPYAMTRAMLLYVLRMKNQMAFAAQHQIISLTPVIDLCSCDNYQGIALFFVLCKVIDIIVIERYRERCLSVSYSSPLRLCIQQVCVRLL